MQSIIITSSLGPIYFQVEKHELVRVRQSSWVILRSRGVYLYFYIKTITSMFEEHSANGVTSRKSVESFNSWYKNGKTIKAIPAYERLSRPSVSTGVPSTSLNVTRRWSVVSNVGNFGVFSGYSRFSISSHQHSPLFHSLVFMSLQSSFTTFMVRKNSWFDAQSVYNHVDWWRAKKRGVHHVLLQWTPSPNEHRIG